MNGEILLQLASMFMFTTDLTPQGWVFVILVLFGVFAIVCWLLGNAALIWKRFFRE